MELLFGSKVREGSRQLGYLAGLEVDPASKRITRIFFSDNGELGSHAMARPISTVQRTAGRVIEVAEAGRAAAPETTAEPILWSRSTRVVRNGRESGRLVGADVTKDTLVVEAALGRQHWWTRRFRLPMADLTLMTGEVRTAGSSTQAA